MLCVDYIQAFNSFFITTTIAMAGGGAIAETDRPVPKQPINTLYLFGTPNNFDLRFQWNYALMHSDV